MTGSMAPPTPAAANAGVGSSTTAINARAAATNLFPPPLWGRARVGGVHDVERTAPPPPRPSPIKGEGEVRCARSREFRSIISGSLQARVDDLAVARDERALDDLVVPIDRQLLLLLVYQCLQEVVEVLGVEA